MRLFRRKKDTIDDEPRDEAAAASLTPDETGPEALGAADGTAEPGAEDDPEGADTALQGPWDAADPDIPSAPRLDFGALQMPGIDGMGIQMRAEGENAQRVIGLGVTIGVAHAMFMVLATRASGGHWSRIVKEMNEALNPEVVTPRELDGDPPRILAEPVPGSKAMPILLEGHQGKGWMLLVRYEGAAALDADLRAPYEPIIAGCVVSRGSELLAPGDVVALTPPNVQRVEPEAGEGLLTPPPRWVGTGS